MQKVAANIFTSKLWIFCIEANCSKQQNSFFLWKRGLYLNLRYPRQINKDCYPTCTSYRFISPLGNSKQTSIFLFILLLLLHFDAISVIAQRRSYSLILTEDSSISFVWNLNKQLNISHWLKSSWSNIFSYAKNKF